MTAEKTTNLINKAYGYPIIGDAEEAALQADRDVIISELGIGAIFEFLSYDVTEFSEVRKTIHARRFYQLFKNAFSFTGFNMEAFHKIQAGCIFMVAVSGITRGLSDYNYSGFVKDALEKIGSLSATDSNRSSLNEKLFYLKTTFEKFSHISLGIYSLQIFTKYGMSIQKVNKGHEGAASRLLVEIIEDMNMGKKASGKIDKLLSMDVVSPDELENIIDDYIDYAVADITVQGISPGSKKAERANKKLTDEISDEVHDAFSGLKIDAADLYSLNESIKLKKIIYDKEHGQPGVAVFFAALLERYVSLYERLWYYEGNSFIKRLNMIFITRVKEMFADQRKQELNVIKNECIRIIEDNLPGTNVYELEGILHGLDDMRKDFNIRNGLNSEDSEKAVEQLNAYLDANIKTGNSIKYEMKKNLSRILGPDGLPEGELRILRDIVYDFDEVMNLLTEEDQ